MILRSLYKNWNIPKVLLLILFFITFSTLFRFYVIDFKHVKGLIHQSNYVNWVFLYFLVTHAYVFIWVNLNISSASNFEFPKSTLFLYAHIVHTVTIHIILHTMLLILPRDCDSKPLKWSLARQWCADCTYIHKSHMY